MVKLFNKACMTENRQALRNNMPEPEHRLWLHLRGRKIRGYKFRRQVSIENYIVDFYCPQLKLAVELDGDSHREPKALVRDAQRQKNIERHGIRVVRFTNIEIVESLEGVVAAIMNHVPDSSGTR